MYFETHINIKKIPKIAKKIANLQKKLHCFPLFEVLYDWEKIPTIKDGETLYITVGKVKGLFSNFFESNELLITFFHQLFFESFKNV